MWILVYAGRSWNQSPMWIPMDDWYENAVFFTVLPEPVLTSLNLFFFFLTQTGKLDILYPIYLVIYLTFDKIIPVLGQYNSRFHLIATSLHTPACILGYNNTIRLTHRFVGIKWTIQPKFFPRDF